MPTITRVEVTTVQESGGKDKRLKGFCSLVLDDCLAIHDIKIIEGDRGLFISMPSKKVGDHCPACGHKNPLTDCFCGSCGAKVPRNLLRLSEGHLFADVAHPVAQWFREEMERKILFEYRRVRRMEYVEEKAKVEASSQTSAATHPNGGVGGFAAVFPPLGGPDPVLPPLSSGGCL